MATVLQVHGAVWALLSAITGVNAYDGEILDAQGQPTTPPADEDGRVAAYAVLYFSPGARFTTSLNAEQAALASSWQVTCVGGDPTRALWCVDQVREALVGSEVTLDGRTFTVRTSTEDPGTVRRDDDKKPPRHYVPLGFTLLVP